jgi:hypothetical protein
MTDDVHSEYESIRAHFSVRGASVPLNLLAKHVPIDDPWYLAEPCDGLFIHVSMYDPASLRGRLVRDYVAESGDPFAERCMQIGHKFGDLVFAIGVDTRAPDMTFIDLIRVPAAVQTYLLKALLAYCDVPANQVTAIALSGVDALNMCEEFFAKCFALRNNNLRDDAIGYAILLNLDARIEPMIMQILALQVFFSVEDNGTSIFFIDVVNNGIFKEPIIWKINYADQIIEMINDLRIIADGHMSTQAFLEKYVPAKPHPMDFDARYFALSMLFDEKWMQGQINLYDPLVELF